MLFLQKESDKTTIDSDSTLDTMIEYAMLFDFYGALLKEKNMEIFEDYMFNDMSLSEIAEEHDMTRQGVRDIVVRSKEKLISYEEKLGLVARFNAVKKQRNDIMVKTEEVKQDIKDCDGVSTVRTEIVNEYFEMIDDMAETILEDM